MAFSLCYHAEKIVAHYVSGVISCNLSKLEQIVTQLHKDWLHAYTDLDYNCLNPVSFYSSHLGFASVKYCRTDYKDLKPFSIEFVSATIEDMADIARTYNLPFDELEIEQTKF